MQHAPKNTATWLFRLAAYVKAAEREGDSSVIDDIACIPVDGKWWKPTGLALQGRRGDFWGNWKKTISAKGRSAEEQDILRKVGVVPGEPTSEYSHGFFQWLEHSEPPELQENLERIVRHFDHSQGVLAWWKYYQNTRCLPVRDDRTMRLVSFAHAVRAKSRVCIDDFPELANRMREKRTDRFFVIDRHPKLDASITGRIRDEPIQRLSRIAGQPVRVRSIGECEGDSELNVMMKHIQTGKFKREMKSRLAQWDIPAQHLRGDWHKRISAIRQIALCREVVADFRVGAYYYDIQMTFQFDEPSGTLFVVDREGDKMTALFDAVSNYIFRIDTPKMAKAAFEKVVLTKLPEFEHIDPGPFADAVDAESLDGGTENDTTDDITESRRTHRWPPGSESRNLPQPQQLSRSVRDKAGSTTFSGDGKSRPKAPVRLRSNPEEKHKQQLKEIYAWHCQVCLARKTPQQLAPEGSYVFFQENRRCLIEAHHPDQVHARGARHGGNLLVVCQFHHRQFGDAISRSQFTNALQTAATSREVSYTLGSGANEKLNGVVVEVPVLTTGKTLPFFFANEHRKYWIKNDERKQDADTQHVD